MPQYDHDAIRKAYPDAVTIDDTHGAFKLDGTKIDLVQSVIDAARVELNKLNYQRDRAIAYPSIQEQLDMQYWDQMILFLSSISHLIHYMLRRFVF